MTDPLPQLPPGFKEIPIDGKPAAPSNVPSPTGAPKTDVPGPGQLPPGFTEVPSTRGTTTAPVPMPEPEPKPKPEPTWGEAFGNLVNPLKVFPSIAKNVVGAVESIGHGVRKAVTDPESIYDVARFLTSYVPGARVPMLTRGDQKTVDTQAAVAEALAQRYGGLEE